MFSEEIRVDKGRCFVCVNPAVECLGIFFVLADFELNKVRSNANYVAAVKKRFGGFKKHKAVREIAQLLTNQYFKYNGPIEMFLNIYYGRPIDEKFCKKFKLNKKMVDKFLISLQDFVLNSNFNEFFKNYSQYYLLHAQKFFEEVKNFSPVEYLVNFLKLKAKKLNVLLMFGVTTANYGVEVASKPYCCVRPYKTSGDEDVDFAYNKPYVTTLLLHEFAHTFINPLTKKYKDKLAKIDKNKFKQCFEKNPYGDDIETVVNEHIIRAIECMYVKDNFAGDYKSFVDNYFQDGFLCLEDLMQLYCVYLKSNKSNFADFYGNIIDYFL